MKKKKIQSILEIDMSEFYEVSEEVTSGQELVKEFNRDYDTNMHYNDFQALLYRAFGNTYHTDDQGYNAYALKLKTREVTLVFKEEE